MSSKRKSDSTQLSDRLERLAENRILMKISALMQRSSKELCRYLLKHKSTPVRYTSFPRNKLAGVLERVQVLNKGRVRRDVTPWIVPSAETLFFCDVRRWAVLDPSPAIGLDCYSALLPKMRFKWLKNYSSPPRPVLFTPDLSFTFLICEVETGEQGLIKADRQNIHSTSIAVMAIIELFKAAFGSSSNPERVSEKYGKALVFTVSHDHDRVCLYANFAVLTGQNTEPGFYRYPIAFFSLSANDGKNTSTVSNLVRNVCDKFAPEHRQRIKEAATVLQDLGQQTDLSFTASELALDELAFEGHNKEILKLKEQLELQRLWRVIECSQGGGFETGVM